MRKFRLTRLVMGCLWVFPCVAAYAQEVQVRNLKVDLLQKPMLQVVNGYPVVGAEAKTGEQSLIRNRQPILGWELSSTAQGAMQSAYRVMMATHPDSLAKGTADRSEEHTSELQSLMRLSYAVFCLKKKTK